MKILIADDSTMMRMILRDLLAKLQVSAVEEATNGQEVLKILAERNFDLLLIDLHMPVLDGLDCIREIRRRSEWANLSIVVISSDAEPASNAQALEAGAAGFIKKPFRLESLKEALDLAERASQDPDLAANSRS